MDDKQKQFAEKILAQAYIAKARTGLPASILAAQCILETGWGRYVPVCRKTGKYSYNLFGIKGRGTNGSVEVITHEYINGEKLKVIGEFRAYNNYNILHSFIVLSNKMPDQTYD